MQGVDAVSCHRGIVRGGGGHSQQESVETAAAGVDARFAHPGPQSGRVEPARCSPHGREWCHAKLRERVGGDRGIGVFQPGSEPPQPLARWQIAGGRRRHVAQQRLVGRDCRPGETGVRGLRGGRPVRAKEHRRSGDRPGHASRHGRADDRRVARVAEHLVDAKSLHENAARVRRRRSLRLGDGHDGRGIAPLRERLPDRAAERACRRRRRG